MNKLSFVSFKETFSSMFPVGQLQTGQVRFSAICYDNILLRLDYSTPRFSVNVWLAKHNI